MNTILSPRAQASTDQVPPSQRLEFWESYNASELIGLICSTYDPQGLHAQGRVYDAHDVAFTDIRGNQHVIERTRELLKTHPKDSIFACLLLEGDAFLFQSGQCYTVRAGDVIVYSNAVPYLYGFTGNMRQLIVEIESARLFRGRPELRPAAPIQVDNRLRTGRLIANSLRSMALDFVENPQADAVPLVAEQAHHLLHAVLDPEAARALNDTAAWRLLRAEAFIAERLGDPGLDAAMVARAMGLSVRQLHRLFAHRDRSVTQWIWDKRLERAHQELANHRMKRLSIGDIADRWGFASQAHFSRAFRARYGMTPTQHRRGARL
ncbi:MAG: helix-turn-helix domain-containing protein [Pigmentiphaga sp.]|uniref:helix-turn-helix domain-containing protein n=1 Tax=Pigmentiphaga sp. TaxID=1977564 RepID=UPI0029A758E4|nr:helix-turn-helix domain-containing protein [Pigmentiphaga sp.]MDX3906313.1 helix-turn-helix domain-containing protein [Pigmentiphaga sp.]